MSGLELSTASTSTTTVCNSSYDMRAWPIAFFKWFFIIPISRSKNPPHQGDLSKLNSHCIFWVSRYRCTTGSSISFFIIRLADLNVLALSVINKEGSPLLATKRQKHLMNDSADKQVTTSRWTARTTAHVKRQIQNLSPEFDIVRGPVKSIPVQVNGGASPTLGLGRGGALGGKQGEPSSFRQMTQR